MGEDLEPTDGRWFLGIKNQKWFIREVRKIYSNEKSYFSKKRLESGAAFTIAMHGLIFYFIAHVGTMSVTDLIIWSTPLFLICGYQVNKIQEEKKLKEENDKRL
jgi:hypothetical protein